MTDNLTKTQGSCAMSRIRSRDTRQEKVLDELLKKKRIKHTMYPKIGGRPDIILNNRKVAVFLDGCFWHGCKKHYIEPKSNKEYWQMKIKYNMERDKKNTAVLRKNGWKVIRIWEHQMKDNSDKAVRRVLA